MRKRKHYPIVVVAVLAVLALITFIIGVISYEKEAKCTGSVTKGHAISWYAVCTGRETATKNYTAGNGKKRADVETVGSRPAAGKAKELNTEVSHKGTPVRNTIYTYASYGAGPGDTTDVNTNPYATYYNAEQLADGLLYELKPYANDFVLAQETYNIDAVFLAAVAAEESGYGRYTFRKNNIFGYGSKDFESIPQCIDYVARKIRENYLSPNGIYYEGCSVAQIGVHYNGRDTWVNNVSCIMQEITERVER